MFKIHHTDAFITIREWLDDISYSTLNRYMMKFLDQAGQLYPDFYKFIGIIDRINPFYAFILSVLRIGQPTERESLEKFLSAEIIEALLETGLLEQKEKYFKMPQVGILPLGGMYFITSLPETYPTSLRNNKYKPVDQAVQLAIDAIESQPMGEDFLEVYSDYGILANMAATKGFKNIQIQPKHPDCIPFIQMNLALNHHEGVVITDCCANKYDLIACINLSVKDKIEGRNQKIEDENTINQLLPVFRQLKDEGKAIVLLESVGTISEIKINERLKVMDGFNIQSVVLNKIPYPALALSGYVQTSWERQFDLVPCDYIEYVKKTIKSSESIVFVFTQLLKFSKRKKDEPFILYPFYNPKYSDPLFNYASSLV